MKKLNGKRKKLFKELKKRAEKEINIEDFVVDTKAYTKFLKKLFSIEEK